MHCPLVAKTSARWSTGFERRSKQFKYAPQNGSHFYIFLFQNVTENDYGKYYCLAKNSQGETNGEIALYGNIYAWNSFLKNGPFPASFSLFSSFQNS